MPVSYLFKTWAFREQLFLETACVRPTSVTHRTPHGCGGTIHAEGQAHRGFSWEPSRLQHQERKSVVNKSSLEPSGGFGRLQKDRQMRHVHQIQKRHLRHVPHGWHSERRRWPARRLPSPGRTGRRPLTWHCPCASITDTEGTSLQRTRAPAVHRPVNKWLSENNNLVITPLLV